MDHPKPTSDPPSNGNGKSKQSSSGSGKKTACSADVTDESTRPDWLPAGWKYKEYLRTSGASAGTKDKYFIDPITSRRFRSKKEVFRYIETGTTPKQKRKSDSVAQNAVQVPNSATPKRNKSEAKPKVSIKNFNYDDVPEKVKWCLTDVYEGTWGPKINDGDKVLESSKQEWHAAFTYLTLQNGGKAMF